MPFTNNVHNGGTRRGPAHEVGLRFSDDDAAHFFSEVDMEIKHGGQEEDEEADLLACIAYGAEMSRERYVEIPLAPAA